MRLFAILLALILQNPPQNPLGTIEGIVTRTGPAAPPIAGARVKVWDARQVGDGPRLFSAETTTDGNGRFNVADVPAGPYEIEITHEDFGFGNRVDGPFRGVITVPVGQSVRVPPVALAAPAVILGHVLDADGNGVPAAPVEILRVTTDGQGRKSLSAVNGRVLTDAQGAYRKTLYGSGDYTVRVVVESGPVPVTVYYPSTTESSDAAPVILPEGSEKVADIRIGSALTVEGFKISGKVMLPPVDAGAPFIQLTLTKRDSRGSPDGSPAVVGSTRANDGIGDFEFPGIRPGNYLLSASSRINGLPYAGKVPIQIRDQDMDGVELALRPPFEIRGSLLVDGEPQDVQFSRPSPYTGLSGMSPASHAGEVGLHLSLRNSLSPEAANLPNPILDPTGKSFSYSGILEGDYKLTASLVTDGKPSSRDLYVADIRVGGRSVIDSGFQVGLDPVDAIEVVVGTKGGTIIEGQIVGRDPELPSILIVIPQPYRESDVSLSRSTLVPPDGHFHIAGLAPGTYKVFASPFTDGSVLFLRNPGFISRNESRALSVIVEKGKTSGGLQVPYLSTDK